MTNCKPRSIRRKFDVRVYFGDGSRITVCNVPAEGHAWERDCAMRAAEIEASSRRYSDRGGIHAVAIEREHISPCGIHGVSCF